MDHTVDSSVVISKLSLPGVEVCSTSVEEGSSISTLTSIELPRELLLCRPEVGVCSPSWEGSSMFTLMSMELPRELPQLLLCRPVASPSSLCMSGSFLILLKTRSPFGGLGGGDGSFSPARNGTVSKVSNVFTRGEFGGVGMRRFRVGWGISNTSGSSTKMFGSWWLVEEFRLLFLTFEIRLLPLLSFFCSGFSEFWLLSCRYGEKNC